MSTLAPLHAAIVTHEHGGEERGRIGDIVGSEFQFFSDRFYIIDSRRIKRIEVDSDLDGKALLEDKESVAKLRLLIDKRNIDVEAMQRQVRKWLREENYEALEQQAALLGINRTRWGDGSWAIDDFYLAMTNDISRRSIADFNTRRQQVEAWVAASPRSIAAKLSLVQVLKQTGWAHRGGGYSSTVTRDRWREFRKHLQRAARIAEEIADAGLDHPAIFDISIELLNPLGVEKKTLKGLALQSLEAHPEYYPVYAAANIALLRQWGGKRGEVQAFIERVSKQLEPTYPEAIYLTHRRFYRNFQPREYADMNFNWRHIRIGFEGFRKKFHANDADYHLMAMLACLHGDKAAALDYFDATSGTWNYLAERIWRKQEKMESYRKWAGKVDPPYYAAIKKAIIENDVPVLSRLVRSNPGLLDIFLHKDLYGDTILHELAARNDYEMLAILADLGVALESRNDSDYTPLQWAAYFGQQESVATLLAYGADAFNRKGSRGDQAAHIAARNGFKSVLAILARHDPKTIVSPNDNQTTPLHYAAWNGQLDSVTYLLDAAPQELDRQDKYQYTPLHYAIDRGHGKIVALLTDKGADTGLTNKAGYTALSFARKKEFTAIETFLRNLGAADSQVVDKSEMVRKASEIYQRSSQYFNQQDYQKAIEIYHESLDAYPDYYLAYAGLAQVAFDFEKDFEKADRYFDKSIELNPGYAENYYWKARTNYNLNRPEVYRPLFRKYIEMAPDTYNTIDLKKNWSHLLVDEPALGSQPAPLADSPLKYVARYREAVIAGLIVFIGLLLLLRWRQAGRAER